LTPTRLHGTTAPPPGRRSLSSILAKEDPIEATTALVAITIINAIFLMTVSSLADLLM